MDYPVPVVSALLGLVVVVAAIHGQGPVSWRALLVDEVLKLPLFPLLPLALERAPLPVHWHALASGRPV